jgi:hypothetical protein
MWLSRIAERLRILNYIKAPVLSPHFRTGSPLKKKKKPFSSFPHPSQSFNLTRVPISTCTLLVCKTLSFIHDITVDPYLFYTTEAYVVPLIPSSLLERSFRSWISKWLWIINWESVKDVEVVDYFVKAAIKLGGVKSNGLRRHGRRPCQETAQRLLEY